jgi:hypothetical protein
MRAVDESGILGDNFFALVALILLKVTASRPPASAPPLSARARHALAVWASSARQRRHEAGQRGFGVSVDESEISFAASPAIRTLDLQPTVARHQRGADRRRRIGVNAAPHALGPGGARLDTTPPARPNSRFPAARALLVRRRVRRDLCGVNIADVALW